MPKRVSFHHQFVISLSVLFVSEKFLKISPLLHVLLYLACTIRVLIFAVSLYEMTVFKKNFSTCPWKQGVFFWPCYDIMKPEKVYNSTTEWNSKQVKPGFTIYQPRGLLFSQSNQIWNIKIKDSEFFNNFPKRLTIFKILIFS